MIISASRRTDIPAFYSDWFLNRISEGYVVTKNPFNVNQLTKLRLDPSVVDAIVFWTKNSAPMISRVSELSGKGFIYYFQFTLTPYGTDIEPGLPAKEELIDIFGRLSDRIGRERVIWRYDPIFFSEKYTAEWHINKFEKYSAALKSYTRKVIFSFLDMDYKNTKHISEIGIRSGSTEEKNHIAKVLAKIAHSFNMRIETCAEAIELEKYGITHGKCIDDKLIEELHGCPLLISKDKNQRQICGCVASVDIGIYNTCSHVCTYCYANFTKASIAANREKHNPQSPILIGECNAENLAFKKGQKSLIERQMNLF